MDHKKEVQYLRTDPGGHHYNCAQSLLIPFLKEVGMDAKQTEALGAFFGSGMLHGSTCGVLTGALMILGLHGYSKEEAAELIRRFQATYQAKDCTTLLTRAREAGTPQREHCTNLVMEMTQWLDQLLNSRKKPPLEEGTSEE